jgi:hypothetical protein
MRVRQLGSANKIFRGAIDFASTDTTNSLHHPHVRTHCVYAHAKHKHAHTSKSKHTSGCWGLREVTTMASSITIAHAAAAPPAAAVRLIVNFRLQGLNLESVAFRGRKRPLPDLSMGDVTYFLVGRVRARCHSRRAAALRRSARGVQKLIGQPWEHAATVLSRSSGLPTCARACSQNTGMASICRCTWMWQAPRYIKRDLFVCQKRPICMSKRHFCMSKEAYLYVTSATAQFLKSALYRTFSKVLSIVPLHNKCTRSLTATAYIYTQNTGIASICRYIYIIFI